MKSFALFILLALLPAVAFGQTFSTPVQVSAHQGAHSPCMHTGRDGTIYVSWFENSADIYFSHSTDGGSSFTTPVRVAQQVTTNKYTSLLQRSPEFVVDTKGRIHLVWTEARIGAQSDVWYVRSTDKGASWSQPASIMDADDSANDAQDFSAIACDSSDNLYVSYLDNRYLMRGIIQHYKMHLERSTDGGTSWSKPIVADDLPIQNSGTCECCRQDIAVSREGHVYIAFRTNMTQADGDKRDIFVCRSMDGGLTFEPSIRAQLGGWTLPACPTKGPHITLDGNEDLHIAWSDARDDSGKLISYYSFLRKGDSTIFPNYSVSGSRTQNANWPSIARGRSGIIAEAYELDYPNPSQPCRFSYSSDGGNTWSSNSAFPGASSDAQILPIMEFSPQGNLYAVWEDGDKQGILFSKISGMNDVALLSTFKVQAAKSFPSGSPIHVTWTKPAGTGTSPFVWYLATVAGSAAAKNFTTRDTTIDITSLPDGQYTVIVTAIASTGASNTASGSFVVGAASVARLSQRQIIAYPNPLVSGIARIQVPEADASPVELKVIDELGAVRRVAHGQIENASVIADLRGLASGAYHIILTIADQLYCVAVTLR